MRPIGNFDFWNDNADVTIELDAQAEEVGTLNHNSQHRPNIRLRRIPDVVNKIVVLVFTNLDANLRYSNSFTENGKH